MFENVINQKTDKRTRCRWYLFCIDNSGTVAWEKWSENGNEHEGKVRDIDSPKCENGKEIERQIIVKEDNDTICKRMKRRIELLVLTDGRLWWVYWNGNVRRWRASEGNENEIEDMCGRWVEHFFTTPLKAFAMPSSVESMNREPFVGR